METSKKKFNLKMPHSFIIIGILVVIVAILTHIVPAGQFERMVDPNTGRNVIVPDSFKYIESTPVGFFQIFVSIYRGMVESADIIFFSIIAFGMVYMLVKTGAFNGAVGTLLKKMDKKEKFMIPVFMLFFSLCGTTFGMWESSYGLIPIFVGLAIAMGYDGLVGAVIVVVGIATGFASAISNPFTVAIAQGISGLPIFSGVGFRVIVWVGFTSLAIWYTMRYASKIKADPKKSVVFGVKFPMMDNMSRDELVVSPFTTRHKISVLVFVLTIVTVIIGSIKYDWYLNELSGLFLLIMFVIGLINKMTFSEIAESFIEGAKAIIFGALIIGISRGVLIVMRDGCIIDTVVYFFATKLANLSRVTSALGMLIVQNIFNFFIPSGSGQAAVTMPIMSNLADLVGLNRQIAVLAYQFGDGFSNLFWPTAVAVECGIAGVPLDKWYKFMTPLFGMMVVLEIIFMIIAVAVNLGPF